MTNNYHFAELIQQQAFKYNTKTAIKYRDDQLEKWKKISWSSFAEKVQLTAQAIVDYGLDIQHNIGVYSQNMPECIFLEFGAFRSRTVTVPMYPTSSPSQIEYILKDANISLLFVGEQLQYNNALIVQENNPGLIKQIVIFGPAVRIHPKDQTSFYFEDFLRHGDNTNAATQVNIRANEATETDVATIVYTSGTTSGPKGVVLTHGNFMHAMVAHDNALPKITEKDLSMCFLPLTHIFEKAWTCYCLHRGATIAINKDPKRIQQMLPEVQPTLMCNVPRFWEKVYTGVLEKIGSSSPIMRSVFKRAIKVGHRYITEYKRVNKRAPILLSISFFIYNVTAFNILKRVLGLKRGRFFPVAGAPLSDKVAEFLLGVNFPIVYGYGLSETTATVSFYPTYDYVIGSIGKTLPGLDVKIDPANNEILVKGKTIMREYYNKPEETAAVFTEDGYFRTGDAGRIEGNTLFFTERIKELYKTSNGKYISPQSIEMSMSSDRYVEQIAVFGDDRKLVSALIYPSFSAIEKYASEAGISYNRPEELLLNPKIIKLIYSRIELQQKDFASFERIKKFVLIEKPFSMENGELTDTLKLKRRVIQEHYATEIESMYEE